MGTLVKILTSLGSILSALSSLVPFIQKMVAKFKARKAMKKSETTHDTSDEESILRK